MFYIQNKKPESTDTCSAFRASFVCLPAFPHVFMVPFVFWGCGSRMISTSDFAYSKSRADIREQMCVALEAIKMRFLRRRILLSPLPEHLNFPRFSLRWQRDLPRSTASSARGTVLPPLKSSQAEGSGCGAWFLCPPSACQHIIKADHQRHSDNGRQRGQNVNTACLLSILSIELYL